MRKELVWASIIGISLGLIIAFGVWRMSSSFKSKNPAALVSPTPSPIPGEFKITLDKPENGDVLTENSVSVSGITKALTWITVSGENGDYILQADEQGVFTQNTDLIGGVNQIKVTAFDENANESIEKVLVVYSSSFQVKSNIDFGTGSTTSGETDIRQKVAQKVADALNRPKAYIGVITDITDSTVQIKTMESEIKQISVASDTISVVNAKGATSKQVKLTDLAIGDFIVAMGYINSNSVLSAQRILVVNPITEPTYGSTFGQVVAVTKKSITVREVKSQKEAEVAPTSKTSIISFSKDKIAKISLTGIKENERVIYVTNQVGNSPQTRSIFKLDI